MGRKNMTDREHHADNLRRLAVVTESPTNKTLLLDAAECLHCLHPAPHPKGEMAAEASRSSQRADELQAMTERQAENITTLVLEVEELSACLEDAYAHIGRAAVEADVPR